MITTPEGRILLVLSAILTLNFIQAGTLGLSGDEALYWMYSRELSWGFKDHPPVIGILTGIGYFIFQNELGVRLMIVICQLITMYVLFRMVEKISWWFIVVVLSIPILHVYGFIATPDAPLLMFSALFIHRWKKFLEDGSTRNSIILGVLMALMLWSKYHGFLVIVLVILPHMRLWFSRQLWIAIGVGIILFTPHIIWQAVNDLPSLKFHLVERSGEFTWRHVTDYFGGQFLVFNPVCLLACIVIQLKKPPTSNFERSMRWMLNGMLIVFLLSSMRGRVEPHWTASACLPLLLIMGMHMQRQSLNMITKSGVVFFAVVIMLARVVFMTGELPLAPREFSGNEERMNVIRQLAGDRPVCFINSYQDPSLYMFYTGNKAHSVNNIYGGKNQYDYWQFSRFVHRKPFLLVSNSPAETFQEHTLKNGRKIFTREETDRVFPHRLMIRTDEWLVRAQPGDTIRRSGVLTNGNLYTMEFEKEKPYRWQGLFNGKKENEFNMEIDISGIPSKLEPGEKVPIEIKFIIPDVPGSHKGAISMYVDDLPPTFQSNWVRLIVER